MCGTAAGTGGAPHVLFVCFVGQGHLNPFLRFAKRVAAKGADVTFSTTENAGLRIRESSAAADGEFTSVGCGRLRFEFFSDGFAPNDPQRHRLDVYMPQLREVGSTEFAALIRRQAEQGRPVDSVVNNPFIPWALDVAVDMGIPSSILWVQSCAVFSTYYHYYHELADFPSATQPDLTVTLPGLRPMRPHELPSFLLPSNPYKSLTEAILGQFKNLDKASWVFVNTFEELESDAIGCISKLKPVIPVGPLVDPPPSKEAGEDHLNADLWKAADCVSWLDRQEPGSVVYVSVGSVVVLRREEVVEMAEGLKGSARPFLWVVRNDARAMLPEGFEEETAGSGLVVEWSPQDRVLAHPATACFLTHCGWNSTLECLASGVPAIAFPQWGDQVTDAKFLVEVYEVGVNLRPQPPKTAAPDEEGPSFTRADVERSVEEVMRGPRAAAIRANAARWKEVGRVAMAEGGSSDKNIRAFLEELRRGEQPLPVVEDDHGQRHGSEDPGGGLRERQPEAPATEYGGAGSRAAIVHESGVEEERRGGDAAAGGGGDQGQRHQVEGGGPGGHGGGGLVGREYPGVPGGDKARVPPLPVAECDPVQRLGCQDPGGGLRGRHQPEAPADEDGGAGSRGAIVHECGLEEESRGGDAGAASGGDQGQRRQVEGGGPGGHGGGGLVGQEYPGVPGGDKARTPPLPVAEGDTVQLEDSLVTNKSSPI